VRTGHRNDAFPRIEASRERTPGSMSSMRKGGLAEAATSPLQVYWSDFIRWSGAPARRGCRAPPSTRCRRSIKLYASGGRDGALHVLQMPEERSGSVGVSNPSRHAPSRSRRLADVPGPQAHPGGRLWGPSRQNRATTSTPSTAIMCSRCSWSIVGMSSKLTLVEHTLPCLRVWEITFA
jgi:hypothetical protein